MSPLASYLASSLELLCKWPRDLVVLGVSCRELSPPWGVCETGSSSEHLKGATKLNIINQEKEKEKGYKELQDCM